MTPRYITYLEYKCQDKPLAYRIDPMLDPWWVIPLANAPPWHQNLKCNESVMMIPGTVDPNEP